MKQKQQWLLGTVVSIAILIVVGLWIRREVRLLVLTLEMHQAVARGHIGAIGKFVDQGVDIDRDNGGRATFFFVVYTGSIETLGDLLEQQGVDFDHDDYGGWTALLVAVSSGNLKMVEFLLDQYDADPNLRNHARVTPVDLAASKNNLDMIELLVEYGASAEAAESAWTAHLMEIEEQTPELHQAINQGDMDLLEELIEFGVDVDTTNEEGITGLHIAAATGNMELAEFFAQQGAQLNLLDTTGRTPLQHAADHGQEEMATFLIQEGAMFADHASQETSNGS